MRNNDNRQDRTLMTLLLILGGFVALMSIDKGFGGPIGRFLAKVSEWLNAALTPPDWLSHTAASYMDWLHSSHYVQAASGIVLPALYLAAGVCWSVVHLWLYARYLGRYYVQAREEELELVGKSSLSDMAEDDREALFRVVVSRVRRQMWFGSTTQFPLKVTEQKRLLALDLLFWPIMFIWYLLGDAVKFIVQSIMVYVRSYIKAKWAQVMGLYLADDSLAQELLRTMAKDKKSEANKLFRPDRFIEALGKRRKGGVQSIEG